jgi:hypothetical protein
MARAAFVQLGRLSRKSTNVALLRCLDLFFNPSAIERNRKRRSIQLDV